MKFTPLLLSSATLLAVGVLGFADHHKKDPSHTEKITAAIPETSLVKPSKARKLLVFSATNGYRHKSIETGKEALSLLGSKTGAYEAVLSDDLSNFEAENIQQFDGICFLNTTQNIFMPHPDKLVGMTETDVKAAADRSEQLKKSFINYIKNGGSFIGIHSATDTCYEWPEYGEMLGGYFSGHPWGWDTPVQIDVEAGKENHPIVAHLQGKPFRFKEEIYQLKEPYDSSKYDMLLRLNAEESDQEVKGITRTDNDFGVSWTKSHGKGRVFYCSIGHNHDMYWNTDVLKTYLNGIQWALGDLKINP